MRVQSKTCRDCKGEEVCSLKDFSVTSSPYASFLPSFSLVLLLYVYSSLPLPMLKFRFSANVHSIQIIDLCLMIKQQSNFTCLVCIRILLYSSNSDFYASLLIPLFFYQFNNIYNSLFYNTINNSVIFRIQSNLTNPVPVASFPVSTAPHHIYSGSKLCVFTAKRILLQYCHDSIVFDSTTFMLPDKFVTIILIIYRHHYINYPSSPLYIVAVTTTNLIALQTLSKNKMKSMDLKSFISYYHHPCLNQVTVVTNVTHETRI